MADRSLILELFEKRICFPVQKVSAQIRAGRNAMTAWYILYTYTYSVYRTILDRRSAACVIIIVFNKLVIVLRSRKSFLIYAPFARRHRDVENKTNLMRLFLLFFFCLCHVYVR